MIDVTFTINGVDYSSLLSTYRVVAEYEYPSVVTTMDGTERYGRVRIRPSVYFRLRPLSDAETAILYSTISGTNTVTYTDPDVNSNYTAAMRFTSNVTSAFGLRSIDGNRYYKGSEMCLRQITPR